MKRLLLLLPLALGCAGVHYETMKRAVDPYGLAREPAKP